MSDRTKLSAGLLMYRTRPRPEVLLVHPGGPIWANRDYGAWSIPKGEPDESEDPIAAARREFQEETGFDADCAELLALGEAKQKSGKLVRVWACEGDADANAVRSNTFSLEWPPRSGQMGEYPEVDRAAWFAFAEAEHRILPGQVVFLERLEALLRDA